jgi:hypothetical protein
MDSETLDQMIREYREATTSSTKRARNTLQAEGSTARARAAVEARERDSEREPVPESKPRERPILYLSRTLRSYEKNYTILERELGAVVWSVLKLQRYLDGVPFTGPPADSAGGIIDIEDFDITTGGALEEVAAACHSELPDIAVGDFVSIRLDLHPVSIVKRNKLSQQKLPPFRVVKIHSSGRAVELDIPSNLSIHPIVSVQHVEKAQDPAKDPFDRYSATSSMLRIVDSRMSSRRPGQKEYLLRRGDDRTSDTWNLTPPAELLSDFEERNAFFEAIQAPYTIVDHRSTRQGTRYRV